MNKSKLKRRLIEQAASKENQLYIKKGPKKDRRKTIPGFLIGF
jgi:hypothetical protein